MIRCSLFQCHSLFSTSLIMSIPVFAKLKRLFYRVLPYCSYYTPLVIFATLCVFLPLLLREIIHSEVTGYSTGEDLKTVVVVVWMSIPILAIPKILLPLNTLRSLL